MKVFATAAAIVLLPTLSFACGAVTVDDITVQHAWARATIGAERPGAFYVEITNAGTTDDALTGIATPAAAMPMLHETVVTDGVAAMPHAMSVPVLAGETVMLAPGGYHGMLMDLTSALNEGDTFPLTLTFAGAGAVTVEVIVQSIASEGSECADAH